MGKAKTPFIIPETTASVAPILAMDVVIEPSFSSRYGCETPIRFGIRCPIPWCGVKLLTPHKARFSAEEQVYVRAVECGREGERGGKSKLPDVGHVPGIAWRNCNYRD